MTERAHVAAVRRDKRRIKEDPPRVPSKVRGGRKQWCRGKVGVEHKLVTEEAPSFLRLQPNQRRDLERRCSVCGRKLDWWFWWGKLNQKPDWVVEWEIKHG